MKSRLPLLKQRMSSRRIAKSNSNQPQTTKRRWQCSRPYSLKNSTTFKSSLMSWNNARKTSSKHTKTRSQMRRNEKKKNYLIGRHSASSNSTRSTISINRNSSLKPKRRPRLLLRSVKRRRRRLRPTSQASKALSMSTRKRDRSSMKKFYASGRSKNSRTSIASFYPRPQSTIFNYF